jgi:Ras-related protein Rab-1A
MVYNIFDRDSFESLKGFLIEIEKNANKNTIKLLIGNKINFDNNREVSYEEGKNFAESNGMKYIETTPENIESFNETLLMFVKEILYGINETISENIIEKKMKKKKNQCIIF